MYNVNSLDTLDFYFNGKWLSDYDGIVASTSGIESLSLLPQLTIQSESVLGMDGAVFVNSQYNPRTFVVPVVFRDITRIREIAGWLRTKTPKPFYFRDDTVQIECMLDGSFDIQPYAYQGVVELKFIALNPYYYSITEKIYKFSTESFPEGDTLATTYTEVDTTIEDVVVVNDGNVPSLPLYKLTGSGTITLVVNNRGIAIEDVEDYVVVDTKYMTVARDGSVPVNFIGKTSGELDKLELQVGENYLTTSSNCTSLEVHCREMWI